MTCRHRSALGRSTMSHKSRQRGAPSGGNGSQAALAFCRSGENRVPRAPFAKRNVRIEPKPGPALSKQIRGSWFMASSPDSNTLSLAIKAILIAYPQRRLEGCRFGHWTYPRRLDGHPCASCTSPSLSRTAVQTTAVAKLKHPWCHQARH